MRPSSAVLAAVIATASIGAGTASAVAATSRLPAGRVLPAAANPGAASPSLSLAVSSGGDPEVAAVGSRGSLWYYTEVKGKWRATKLAGKDTAYSGPSLISGPGSNAAVAVEGPTTSCCCS